MATLAYRVPSLQLRDLRRGGVAVFAAFVVLAGLWLALDRPSKPPSRGVARVNTLVHWQDGQRDWLLVADRASHELVVYDARSGAPLRRLGAEDGLGEVDSIARAGDRLLVHGTEGPAKVLTLPNLRATSLAAR